MQNATKSSSHRVLNIPTCITMSVYGLKHIFFLSLIIHVFICNFELIRVLNMRFKFIFFLSRQQTEPVGSKSPTFSSDSKGSIFVRHEHSSFAMLCQAQAFPVPLIRYVSSTNGLHFISNHYDYDTCMTRLTPFPYISNDQ